MYLSVMHTISYSYSIINNKVDITFIKQKRRLNVERCLITALTLSVPAYGRMAVSDKYFALDSQGSSDILFNNST